MERLALDALSYRVAAAGEPFRTFFEPSALAERLQGIGFRRVKDLDASEINAHYFEDRTDKLRLSSNVGHLMSAEV
jgi:hypothetical protein